MMRDNVPPELLARSAATVAGLAELPRPSRLHLSPVWRELRGARGLLTPPAGWTTGSQLARGDGPPVLLVPGFLAGDWSLLTLGARLSRAGFRPFFAGIERNVDCSEVTMRRLVETLERAGERAGRVAIVGHSRGGLLGRVLARRRPDLVSAVVTLAAPYRAPFAISPFLLAPGVALGLAGTAGVRGLVRLSCGIGPCCARFRADLAAPPAATVPYVSVYSRRDGIVDWRACVDALGDAIEVESGHCGMAADPVTLNRVVDRLEAINADLSRAETPAALAA
jgi:pimeloyl-ACP methyl ester carboxylesterase